MLELRGIDETALAIITRKSLYLHVVSCVASYSVYIHFIVAICGELMTMPGLPKVPSAEVIRLNDQGFVEDLF